MRNILKEKRQKRVRRKIRVRAKIEGTAERPRCSVFRSSRYLYVQFINDQIGRTILAASDQDLGKVKVGKRQRLVGKKEAGELSAKLNIAFKIGELAAKKAAEKGIKEIVFDRGGYRYHGRVKSLADGLRSGGLKF